ncbi:Conserved_hypothetical protein [Hexamita inflata]|uniref:Uncharacterized protein n=1 Tax=Hexamita inflata TaxID=28002 RepID=A0AA86V1L1_9EUKA|nr:Conserved hypothetical protein [Hexamita inflata]
MQFAIIIANEFECFNENVSLIGIRAQSAFYLTTNINTNCNRYAGQELKAVLKFQDVTLPTNMMTTTQIFNPSGQLQVKFQLGKPEFESVLENPSAEFNISFGDQFFYPGTIPVIQHTSFDSRHCWDNVEFSVDYDWAFNISVEPLACAIATQVNVFLEYFNETWIQIPIIPTVVTPPQVFNGFQTGSFDTKNVYFYNTSSNADSTNAVLIKNFVNYFKLHMNTPMRFRVYESDPLMSIEQVFQADITNYGNAKSRACHPQAARSNLQTWYSYTTLNPNLIVDCLQTIPGGKTFYSRQYTYDEDRSFNDHSIFTLALQKFRTRLGIPFYFANTIKVNESKQYYFITMIELRDAAGKMIAALFYQGVAVKSCYQDITTEVYDSKICLNIHTKNNQVCKAQLSSTGIIGTFSGKLDPNISDPTQRQTYFWMKMDTVLTDEWFGNYHRLCFTDAEDTGQFQGTKITGTFKSRMNSMFQKIVKEKMSFTLAFISDTELYYCTKLVSYIVNDRLKYVYVCFGLLIPVITIIVTIIWRKV